MRRAYLELVLLTILKTHSLNMPVNKDIEPTMKKFVTQTPNPMVTDEWQLADQIRNALSGKDGMPDWEAL